MSNNHSLNKYFGFIFNLTKVEILPLLSFIFTTHIYGLLRQTKDFTVYAYSGIKSLVILKSLTIITSFLSVWFVTYLGRKYGFFMSRVYISIPIIIFFIIFLITDSIWWNHKAYQYLIDLAYKHQMFSGIILCIANIKYALYFLIVELWGSIMISNFWICLNLSKSYISPLVSFSQMAVLVIAFGNIGTTLCSLTLYICKILHDINNTIPILNNSLVYPYCNSILFFAVICYVLTLVFHWFWLSILNNKGYVESLYDSSKQDIDKEKTGLIDSFKTILSDPILWNTTKMLLGYNILVSLGDITYKSVISIGSFGHCINNAIFIYILHGIFNFILPIFSSSIISKYDHYGLYLCSYIVLGVVSLSVFLQIITVSLQNFGYLLYFVIPFNKILIPFYAASSKCLKYSFFDPAKEVYTSFVDVKKIKKSKLFVDTITGRVGKGSGGLYCSFSHYITSIMNINVNSYSVASFIFPAIILSYVWCNGIKNVYKSAKHHLMTSV